MSRRRRSGRTASIPAHALGTWKASDSPRSGSRRGRAAARPGTGTRGWCKAAPVPETASDGTGNTSQVVSSQPGATKSSGASPAATAGTPRIRSTRAPGRLRRTRHAPPVPRWAGLRPRCRSTSARPPDHPLTPPAPRPLRQRCSIRKAMMIGTTESSDPVSTAVANVVLQRLGVPGEQAQRNREQLPVGEHDQRQEEVVPDDDELEQEDRDQGGLQQVDHQAEKMRYSPAPIEAPGLDERVGDRGGGVDAGQVHAERADQARQQHRTSTCSSPTWRR